MDEPCVVYVALLGEGTEVWRPVAAEQVGPDLFRLLGPAPEGESWEFGPGAVVRCRERAFAGGARGLVAAEQASA
jgi:hypothetical protein